MSPVEFKKTLCRPVEFKGQGPRVGAGGGGVQGDWPIMEVLRASETRQHNKM